MRRYPSISRRSAILKFESKVNNARLKSKSRRPLQIQKQRQLRPPKCGRYKFKSKSHGPRCKIEVRCASREIGIPRYCQFFVSRYRMCSS